MKTGKKGGVQESVARSIKKHHHTILAFIILVAVLAIILIYLNLMSSFKPGDLVYLKNNPSEIGIVKAFNIFKMNYAVSWPDGRVSEESLGTIEKIAKLGENKINKTTGTLNNLTNKTKQKTPSEDKSLYDTREIETNFSDYFIETAYSSTLGEDKVTGIFYKGLSLGVKLAEKKECKSQFACGKWSECSLDYSLLNLVEKNLSRGIQYIYCEDKNECLPSIIDSRSCYLKENVSVKRNVFCGIEQIEFVNSEGKVVARLNTNNKKGYADVNINLIEKDDCNYNNK